MKKTLSILLCAIMAFCLAAQCATAEPTELTTIRVLGVNGSYSIGSEIHHFQEWVDGNFELWQELTDRLAAKGVKLELDLIESDQYNTNLPTMIAAGFNTDYLQISGLDTAMRIELAKQGVFMPIDEIIKHSDGTSSEFFTTGLGSVTKKLQSLEDGKLYWYSNVSYSTLQGVPAAGPTALVIRKDWLDALGLPMPSTKEEFRETLVKFQETDVNGDGMNDESLGMSLGSTLGIGQWFGLGADVLSDPGVDGNVTSLWYQPTAKDYITYLKSLYDDGLLTPNIEGGDYGAKWSENKIAAFATMTHNFWSMSSIVVPDGATKPDYVAFRATAVEGVEPLGVQGSSPLSDSNSYAFTNTVDPKAAASFLDVICTYDHFFLTRYGIEGLTYKIGEDGLPIRIKEGNRMAENMPSEAVWQWNILPCMYLGVDSYKEIHDFMVNGMISEAQMEATFEAMLYPNHVNQNPSGEIYAIPTIEEMERRNTFITDLSTYSDELITNLIMGNESLDNWDSYIEDLKRLGLDELLEIDQARYDRAQK